MRIVIGRVVLWEMFSVTVARIEGTYRSHVIGFGGGAQFEKGRWRCYSQDMYWLFAEGMLERCGSCELHKLMGIACVSMRGVVK